MSPAVVSRMTDILATVFPGRGERVLRWDCVFFWPTEVFQFRDGNAMPGAHSTVQWLGSSYVKGPLLAELLAGYRLGLLR